MEKRTFIIKPTQPFTLLIYFLTFVIWGVVYYYYYPQQEDGQLTRNGLLHNLFSPNSIFTHILTFSLIWVNAKLLSRLNEKFGVIRIRTIIPELVYILLITSWSPLHTNYMGQVSVLLILIILSVIFNAYRNKETTENAFLVFFLTSLLVLILHEWLILVPFFFLFFWLLESFSFKVFLAGILGFLPAYSIIFGYHYLVNDKLPNIIGNLRKIAHFNWIEINNHFLINYIVLLLLFLVISLIQMNVLRLQDNTKQRQYNLILKLFILAPIILIFFRAETILIVLPLLGMVYSFLFSYSIALKKSMLNQIVFYLFVVISMILPFVLILTSSV